MPVLLRNDRHFQCSQRGKKPIGSDEAIQELQAGDDPRAIQQKMQDGVDEFLKLREKYLLYR